MIFRHRYPGRTIGVARSLGAYGVVRQLIVLLMAALLTGARAEFGRDGSVSDVALVLAEGIHELNDPSADFRAVLRAMPSRLDANSTLKRAVLRFIARLPPASADFKCSDDFLRNRARQELIRLQQALLTTTPDRVEPQFCFAVPYVIDAGKAPDAVEIYGFDFDAMPIQMVRVNRGNYEDVSSGLIRRSHYHLTLQLGKKGVALRGKTETLGLAWGNLIHHSISVITPNTPLCPSDVAEISIAKPITYSPPAVSGTSVAGSAVGKALASAALDYEGNAVYATICMATTSRRDGQATFSGCNREFVATIDTERDIEQLFGRLESQAEYTGGSRTRNQNGNTREPILSWRFLDLASQDAQPKNPRVAVTLRQIRVVTIKPEDCVSPIAYRQARREGALGAATIKALDAGLRRVDPSLFALRPRFAPPVPR